MDNQGRSRRDRLFIRLAADGTAIANSAIWRKHIPKGSGRWKDITSAVANSCCSGLPQGSGSYIMIRNTTAASNITAISFPGYEWTGTLANGGYLIVPMPYDFNETVAITVSSFAGRTMTNSTVQGTGVISSPGALAALTTNVTVTSVPGSQYLVVLS
jgi:hypothetical protein